MWVPKLCDGKQLYTMIRSQGNQDSDQAVLGNIGYPKVTTIWLRVPWYPYDIP